ncbi:hypothetical protein FB45DRAFT_898160, partial [Roridomyces roridus]
MSTPRILPELIEVIVDQIGDLEEDTVKACSLISTAFVGPSQRRLFHYLHLRDTEAMPKLACDGNVISPDRARDFFASSPHLASYVRKLAISIPSRRIQNRFRGLSIGRFSEHEPKEDLYIAFQTVLPAFTRVKQLTLSGPHDCAWTSLPEPFTSAVYAVLALPTMSHLRVFGLTIPASLITVKSASVRELSLASTTAPLRTLVVHDSAERLRCAPTCPGALHPPTRELDGHLQAPSSAYMDVDTLPLRPHMPHSNSKSRPPLHARTPRPRTTHHRRSRGKRMRPVPADHRPSIDRQQICVPHVGAPRQDPSARARYLSRGFIPEVEAEEGLGLRSQLQDVHWYLHSLESEGARGRRKFDGFVPFIEEQMSIRSDLGMMTTMFWHLLSGRLVEKRVVES